MAMIPPVARTSQRKSPQTNNQQGFPGIESPDEQNKGIAPFKEAWEAEESNNKGTKDVLCTQNTRAQCLQCVHPPPLFGHSCNSRSPAPCGSVGNDCNKERPKRVRPGVSSDTGIPGATSGFWTKLSLLAATVCLLATMARFDLEELELPSSRGDGEATEGLTPDWMSFYRRRPPLVTTMMD